MKALPIPVAARCALALCTLQLATRAGVTRTLENGLLKLEFDVSAKAVRDEREVVIQELEESVTETASRVDEMFE